MFKLDPKHESFDLFNDQIIQDVWREKYALPNEKTIFNTFDRVVRGVYKNDAQQHGLDALTAMSQGLWMPGGRILASVGTDSNSTLMNCFVCKDLGDSMESIMSALSDSTITLSKYGGIGMNFSTIRPKGAVINRVGLTAPGILTFMDLWHETANKIMQAGHRRGAMMGVLADWHPDLLDFIEAKHTPGRLTNFNVSILISDAFMTAVKKNTVWTLRFPVAPSAQSASATSNLPKYKVEGDDREWWVYKQISARELWEKITRSTYEYSEPGVIFIDRINKMNNLQYCETIECTNPCLTGETLVTSSKGLVRLDSIIEGDSIYTIKGIGKVERIEKHISQPIFKVTLKSGQVLRATAGHIFHVKRAWWDTNTRLDQLKPGDILRLCPGIPPRNSIQNPFKGTDRDYGFLLGVILGDGSYTPANTYIKIAIGSLDTEWYNELCKILQRMGETANLNLNLNESRGNSATIQLSQKFADIIRATTLIPKKSYDKGIPLEFLNSNEEFLWGLFDGLISTDGVVHKHQLGGGIKLTTSSLDLAKGFQRLCHLLGMNGRIYLSKRTGKKVTIVGNEITCKRDMYEVVLTGEHFQKVATVSYLSHPRKNKTLQDHAKTFRPTGDRWETSIVAIEPDGVEDVYDLYEAGSDTWITEGVVSRGCGEQPLPPNGTCNLGAVNLARVVEKPFTSEAQINFSLIRSAVQVGVRFLDNVIDVTKYPLEAQAIEEKKKRRLGLGVSGLADMLAQQNSMYGSPDAQRVTRVVMRWIRDVAYVASSELSKERGAFPLYDKVKFEESGFVKQLPPDIQVRIAKHGIRNGVLLTVAPTGTTSILFGNISSGIEPIFKHYTKRKMWTSNTETKEYTSWGFLARFYQHCMFKPRPIAITCQTTDWLPSHFVTADEVNVTQHVEMQTACQEYVDASISKTINVPKAMTYEEFVQVYDMAYAKGCKGCTTYRPSEVRGAVLEDASLKANLAAKTKSDEELGLFMVKKEEVVSTTNFAEQAQREDVLLGCTYKIRWPSLEAGVFLTINEQEGRPWEVFIASKDLQKVEWTTALSVMISYLFQHGTDPLVIADQLSQIRGANDGQWVDKKFYGSLVAYIGEKLRQHFTRTSALAERLPAEELTPRAAPSPKTESSLSVVYGPACPKCAAPMIARDGCKICTSCTYSSCG